MAALMIASSSSRDKFTCDITVGTSKNLKGCNHNNYRDVHRLLRSWINFPPKWLAERWMLSGRHAHASLTPETNASQEKCREELVILLTRNNWSPNSSILSSFSFNSSSKPGTVVGPSNSAMPSSAELECLRWVLTSVVELVYVVAESDCATSCARAFLDGITWFG